MGYEKFGRHEGCFLPAGKKKEGGFGLGSGEGDTVEREAPSGGTLDLWLALPAGAPGLLRGPRLYLPPHRTGGEPLPGGRDMGFQSWLCHQLTWARAAY